MKYFYTLLVIGILGLASLGPLRVLAQESTRVRVETKEDLLKAFQLDETLQPRRISKGIGQPASPGFLTEEQRKKGIERIADNYDDLRNLPTAEVTIHFAYNSADILPDSYNLLEMCADVLHENPGVKVLIAGHTDHIGSNAFNQELSQRRAEAVGRWLVQQHHVDPQRLVVRAYGEDYPVEDNGSAWGRAQNRRVEFMRYE